MKTETIGLIILIVGAIIILIGAAIMIVGFNQYES